MLQVVNEANIGPVTAFRLYPDGMNWQAEQAGHYTQDQIEHINGMNASFLKLSEKVEMKYSMVTQRVSARLARVIQHNRFRLQRQNSSPFHLTRRQTISLI